MGKIFKNPNAPVRTQNSYANSSAPTPKIAPKVAQKPELPKGTVIALDKFDAIFSRAEKYLQETNYLLALKDLVDLEVTNFDNIEVHELLADVYLKLDQLDLAKEQCQICAQLITKQQGNDNIFTLRSFDELVNNAGNFDDNMEEYTKIMQNDLTEDQMIHGTKVALNLATLHIAENRYQEAEQILSAYRSRYIDALSTV